MDENLTTEQPKRKLSWQGNSVDAIISAKQQEVLRKAEKKHEAHQEIKDRIIDFFSTQQGYRQEDCNIALIEDEKSGANLHFVLDIADDQFPKKFHIKSVSNQKSEVGVKYNEILAYKILEAYGFGPKVTFTSIEFPEGFDQYQDVAERGTNVMVITEDLSNPDPNHPDKTFGFRTKKQAQALARRTGQDKEIKFYSVAPREEEENIQRCMITTIVNLLNLRDVTKNEGNIGLQYAKDDGGDMTINPYVIDFAIGYPSKVENVHESFWSDIIKLSVGSRKFQDIFSASCFAFNPEDNIREAALQKIFVAQDKSSNKAIEIIDQAMEDVVAGFSQSVQEGVGFEHLSNYCDDIKGRFNEFQRLCNEKLQEIELQKMLSEHKEAGDRPSGSPVPEEKGVSLQQGSSGVTMSSSA